MDRLNILKMKEANMKNNLQRIKIINPTTTMVVLIISTDTCNTKVKVLVRLIEVVGIIILALNQINWFLKRNSRNNI